MSTKCKNFLKNRGVQKDLTVIFYNTDCDGDP